MKWIKPSHLEGTVKAPPSKSLTIRAAAAAALARGKSVVHRPSRCDDAQAGFGIAQSLGALLKPREDRTEIFGHWGEQAPDKVLDCRESGLCIRLFAPIAALSRHPHLLTASGSLAYRPIAALEKSLHGLGVDCVTLKGFPPLSVRGPLRSGKIEVDGSEGSQVLTGLLFALPLCTGDSEVEVQRLKSKPYISLTLECLYRFGIEINHSPELDRFLIPGGQVYKPADFIVDGDWSGAAFLLVAGALTGRISVRGIKPASSQADRRILEALQSAGAGVTVTENSATAEADRLRSFSFDASDCPDLFPPLTALASRCRGTSRLYGIDRLKHKESDRSVALTTMFSRLGIGITMSGNHMEIRGGDVRGGEITAFGDHRIAMAGAVAGLVSQNGVGISDWNCVSKSYPGFFSDLESLGGHVQ